MFITIAVTLCSLVGACAEVVVTDSDMDDSLTLQSCMLGQPMIAKWMAEHPTYHSYRVERWRCVPGKYQPRIAS
jgi:hypothetical protein